MRPIFPPRPVPLQRDTSSTQWASIPIVRDISVPILESDPSAVGHRRGLRERAKSLGSRNKTLKKDLEIWLSGESADAGKKLEQAAQKTKWAKRLSSKELDLRGLGLTSLPNLGELRMLRCLDVQDNELEQVPDVEQMPLRLRRVNVLGNPLKKLPESFGQYMQIDEAVFDEKNNRLTIPLQSPPDETGKTISLEFVMYMPRPSNVEERLREVKRNYSFMTNLSWEGKPRDPQLEPRDNDNSGSGLSAQNQLTDAAVTLNRGSFWDNMLDSSYEFSDGSTGGKPNYLSQMSSGHLDGTTPYENQNLLVVRDRLRALTGNFEAEFSLNAILVHHAR
jgi:hypothetical protein